MTVTIIEARIEDIEGLMVLWNDLIEYHGKMDPLYTTYDEGRATFREYLHKLITSEDSRVSCAMFDNEYAGYCITTMGSYPPVLIKKKFGFITDMFVANEYRSAGLGKMLLDDSIVWLKGKGMDRVELRAHSLNDKGVNFWKEVGFTEYLKVMYKDI